MLMIEIKETISFVVGFGFEIFRVNVPSDDECHDDLLIL